MLKDLININIREYYHFAAKARITQIINDEKIYKLLMEAAARECDYSRIRQIAYTPYYTEAEIKADIYVLYDDAEKKPLKLTDEEYSAFIEPVKTVLTALDIMGITNWRAYDARTDAERIINAQPEAENGADQDDGQKIDVYRKLADKLIKVVSFEDFNDWQSVIYNTLKEEGIDAKQGGAICKMLAPDYANTDPFYCEDETIEKILPSTFERYGYLTDLRSFGNADEEATKKLYNKIQTVKYFIKLTITNYCCAQISIIQNKTGATEDIKQKAEKVIKDIARKAEKAAAKLCGAEDITEKVIKPPEEKNGAEASLKVKCENYLLPTDKLNNIIGKQLRDFGTHTFDFANEKDRKKGIQVRTYITISAPDEYPEEYGKSIDAIDISISNALGTIWKNGGRETTISQIWKDIGNTGSPNSKQVKEMLKRLLKGRILGTLIDNREEIKRGYKYEYNGQIRYFLPININLNCDIRKGTPKAKIELIDCPPCFEFAAGRNNLESIPHEVLTTPVSFTPDNVALRNELIRRIERGLKDNAEQITCDYAKIFERSGIIDSKKKQRAKSVKNGSIFKILNYWKEIGYIKSFAEKPKSKTKKPGITIKITPDYKSRRNET